jgi:PAS domain S-box-containing protein
MNQSKGLAAAVGEAIGRRQSAHEVHEAHQALRESERRFKDLAELLPQAVYEMDLQGRLTFVNRQALETFGYTRAEFEAGLSCYQMLAAYEQDRVRQNIRRTVDGQDLGGIEYTAQRKDGAQFPVLIFSSSIRREDAPVGLRGIIVDITERKRAEDRLRESETRYRSLIETTHDVVWAVDANGRITSINQQALQVYGRDPQELLGRPFLEFVVPEEREQARAELQAAVAAGQGRQQTERHVLRADGTRRLLSSRSIVLRDPQGRVSGFFGSSQDITEQRRAEEVLRQSEKVRVEAEKLAATGRVAARIAHEINNPLAGIKNSFHLIRDAVPADHPDRDMVERIDREIARISNIVQQMYKLYSPKVGRTGSVVVGDAIRDVLSMLEPLRRESEVEFDTTGVLPGLSVLVHDGGVHQIVYNLTTNAIKASPPGGVISVSAGLDHRRADFAQISVHDGGGGIPPDVQPRIFEPFFSLQSDNRSKEGLGLGLSIVKSVVEMAGGEIDFESAPGKGTTFRVFLPRQPKMKGQ